MKITLSHILRAALQWRLLLLWSCAMLIPTALLAVPMWQVLSTQLDYSVHAATLAQQLDLVAIADLQAVFQRQQGLFDYAKITALVVTLLISPALSAMALAAARAHRVASFRALFAGARRDYGRMLGMLAWAALPLGLAAGCGWWLANLAASYDKGAVTTAATILPHALATAITVVLVLLAHASVDAGRAVLVLDHRRRSPVAGWWRGCAIIARRPFASMWAYGRISVLGLALAAILGYGRLHLPGGTLAWFLGALALTQLIVAVIGAMRIARLFALVDVARDDVIFAPAIDKPPVATI